MPQVLRGLRSETGLARRSLGHKSVQAPVLAAGRSASKWGLWGEQGLAYLLKVRMHIS